jgi:hypothetical protein
MPDLNVVHCDGKVCCYNIEDSATIMELKKRIEDRTEMSSEHMRLSSAVNGRSVFLQDGRSIGSYGFNSDSVIHMTRPIRGSGPQSRILPIMTPTVPTSRPTTRW